MVSSGRNSKHDPHVLCELVALTNAVFPIARRLYLEWQRIRPQSLATICRFVIVYGMVTVVHL